MTETGDRKNTISDLPSLIYFISVFKSTISPKIVAILLANLYRVSFPHPQHIFAAAQENKHLLSPFRGPSSLLTNIFCADP